MKAIVKILFILSFAVFVLPGIHSQDVKISLFYDQLTEALTFHCTHGEYKISSGDREVMTVTEGDIVFLDKTVTGIRLSDNSGILGEYPGLNFQDVLYRGRFMLKTIKPSSDQRLYSGDLFVSIEHEALELINETEFSSYLAGVVEAEAGPGAPDEFFKAQAVICRTYAIKNWYRHQGEGFNLCDDVHCQAFHGLPDDNPSILNSVLATHDIVIADKNYRLISAAYHSNSGGETQKASEIWPGEHEYLLAIIDPWSVEGRNFKWEEKISEETWLAYLNTRGIDTTGLNDSDFLVKQNHRRVYFTIEEDTLAIREIREDFGLRSPFFSMEKSGDDIVFKGRGYGHGIGLSQEGAMEMARQGYSFEDILRFYYHEIQIKHLDELPESAFPAVFR